MKPIVAVVGRPNVGKSTLVNRLAQTSDAIVHESRGVTRDRSYHTADWNGREFTIVDTGGIEPLKSDDVFATSIRDQALAAAEEAAVILFVVDGRTGVTEEDESVARMLKRCDKPVFLLVNKLDNPDRENDNIWEFYSLGIGEPTPLSALHGHGTGDLLDDIVALLPEEEDEVADAFPDALNVAIIGRPNAGKSSLFNRILGADRSIVSNIAGTTRDAIDTVVERNGKHYRMVDTAGIRKKSTVYENIEYYSMVRGLRAIDRADVALLVVDASVGVTEQDQKVMGLAIERGCAIVVLLNKWDLLDDDRKREACMETIDRRLGVMAPWAQYLRISALTGRSVEKIWAMVDAAEKTRSQKITTSRLNTFLTDLREFGHTVVDGKRRLRMHYVTQTGVNPPTFTFFVNHSDLVNDTYQRYVENRMRSTSIFPARPFDSSLGRRSKRMHNPILLTAICAVVSFFIGAIPFGLILGRVFNHTDIRKAGSGNIGTTNALRVAGPKVAALTLLLDCLKGAICVLIARPLIAGVGYGFPVSIMAPGAPGDWMLGVICLAAVWGHIFSPYLNFHGGKGIAVGLGVILAWYWPIGLSLLGMFIVAVAITKFVSVGSLAAAIGLPIAVCAVFPYCSLGLKFCMALIGITVVWAHRANIKKLMTGKESKLSFTKRVTVPDDK